MIWLQLDFGTCIFELFHRIYEINLFIYWNTVAGGGGVHSSSFGYRLGEISLYFTYSFMFVHEPILLVGC